MIMRNLNLFSQHVNARKGLFQSRVKLQGNRLIGFCLLIALAVTVSVIAKAQSSNSTGSVLIFPYYDSGAVPAQKNTQFNIVNTSGATVKALVILHANATAPNYSVQVVCIPANGNIQFDAYNYDPLMKGTLYVIAVDSSGVPTQANVLTGLAQIKRTSFATNNSMNVSVAAYAVKKLSTGTTGIVINGNGSADL